VGQLVDFSHLFSHLFLLVRLARSGKFEKGVLPHVNKLNPLNRDVTAHAFQAYVDGKAFSAMAGSQKTQPKVSAGKMKPNDPCSCGSAKKFKKCCGDQSKK
jgi:hypothetical protein